MELVSGPPSPHEVEVTLGEGDHLGDQPPFPQDRSAYYKNNNHTCKESWFHTKYVTYILIDKGKVTWTLTFLWWHRGGCAHMLYPWTPWFDCSSLHIITTHHKDILKIGHTLNTPHKIQNMNINSLKPKLSTCLKFLCALSHSNQKRA